MIRQDNLSKMLIVITMMCSVYLATFETTTLVLFPGFLLCFGLVMEIWLERQSKSEVADIPLTEENHLKKILGWTILALMGAFLIGFAIDYKSNFFVVLSVVSAITYSVLMAVAEEQFFRGFITDFVASRFDNEILVWICSAAIFTIYHIARYGGSPDAMTYVFSGGFIFSFVATKSRLISPCMLAHVINNVIAVLGVLGI